MKNEKRSGNRIFSVANWPVTLWWVAALSVPWTLAVLYLGCELVTVFFEPTPDHFARVRAVLVTAMAVIGVPFLVWRTRIADRENRINRESHYTDLFAKSVELLGSTRLAETENPVPAIEPRVGAVFALERLAKDSQRDYGIIIETLSAYVREQCGAALRFQHDGENPDKDGISKQEKARRLRSWCEALWQWLKEMPMPPPANRADVAAALTVLSRRNESRHWKGSTDSVVRPNLSGTNLQGAWLDPLTKGLTEEDIGLPSAHLEKARLNGFEMEGSSLLTPRVQPVGGVLAIGPAQLTGIVACGFTLRSAEFVPILDCADLSYAHMDGANFRAARFRGAGLICADFQNATIQDARFGIANLTGAKFDGADITNAEFMGALLLDASFVGANLSQATFHAAILRGTNFEGALLAGADLTEVNELEPSSIDTAFGTDSTLLPDGVLRPKRWKDEDWAVQQWRAFRNERGMPGSQVHN